MKKFITCFLTIFVLSFSILPSFNVYAATNNNNTLATSNATTQWVALGSGKVNSGVALSATSIVFSAYMAFVPGGYSVSIPTTVISGVVGVYSIIKSNSYIQVSQYRSAGEINSTTLIKTVSVYYVNGKNIGSSTNIVTLGSIFNTYAKND